MPRKRSRITVVDDDEPAVASQAAPQRKDKTAKKAKKAKSKAERAATDGAAAGGSAAVAPPPSLFRSTDTSKVADTRELGAEMLGWMLAPMHPQQFFDEHWEQQPCLIRRPESPAYYADCFCKADLEKLLADGKLTFEHDLDITEYRGGNRSTFNGSGVVDGAQAWAKYEQGCSLRMLCPHAHSPKVWHLLSSLEHAFGSFVGANMYLTPAGTQGFAPHYDDIEAFVLQLEGSKEWLVYPPISAEETLPRTSSKDLTHTDIGQPVMSVTLQAGDMLYFPRGWVHEAKSSPDTHSLHLTVSTALRNTWRDLLELALPGALDAAAADDIDFRQTLPPDMREHMGVMHSNIDDPEAAAASGAGGAEAAELAESRRYFHAKVMELVEKCMQPEYLNVDGAVDEMIRENLRSRMPPAFSASAAAKAAKAAGGVTPQTLVRLVRHDVAQLASGQGGVTVYHCAGNTTRYQQAEEGKQDFPFQVAEAIEYLIKAYPSWTAVEDLPVGESDENDDDGEDDEEGAVLEACRSLVSCGVLAGRS